MKQTKIKEKLKKKRAISMVSLVITIISVVILAGLAVAAGYKYLNEAQKAERQTISNMVQSEVVKLQNDKNINPDIEYVGYKVNASNIISSGTVGKLNETSGQNIEINANDIAEDTSFLEGQWYVLDQKKLSALGVENRAEFLDKYVVEDFAADELDPEEKYGVVLANYETGQSFVVKASQVAIEWDGLDTMPPIVTMYCKDASILKGKHTVTITVADQGKSGLNPNTEIWYAWSTSDIVEPAESEYKVTYTKNVQRRIKESVDVITPSASELKVDEVIGDYYLWVKRGIPDASEPENKMVDSVHSDFYVRVNNSIIGANITVFNSNVYAKNSSYANNNDKITLNVAFDKDIVSKPKVKFYTERRLDGNYVEVALSKVGGSSREYRAEIAANKIVFDGLLVFEIFDLESDNEETTVIKYLGDHLDVQSDKINILSNVTVDKISPEVEYINK